jgi:hypothetical protein
VTPQILQALDPPHVDGIIPKVAEAEVAEMGSDVERQDPQRWVWHAIAQQTGQVFAYVGGAREDEVF